MMTHATRSPRRQGQAPVLSKGMRFERLAVAFPSAAAAAANTAHGRNFFVVVGKGEIRVVDEGTEVVAELELRATVATYGLGAVTVQNTGTVPRLLRNQRIRDRPITFKQGRRKHALFLRSERIEPNENVTRRYRRQWEKAAKGKPLLLLFYLLFIASYGQKKWN